MTEIQQAPEQEGEKNKDSEFEAAFGELWPESRQAMISQIHADDGLLAKLAELANRRVGVLITLSVGGQLISGNPASQNQFYDAVIARFATASPAGSGERLQEWSEAQRPTEEELSDVLAKGFPGSLYPPHKRSLRLPRRLGARTQG